jgi:hypothetical protein
MLSFFVVVALILSLASAEDVRKKPTIPELPRMKVTRLTGPSARPDNKIAPWNAANLQKPGSAEGCGLCVQIVDLELNVILNYILNSMQIIIIKFNFFS